jgi:hypothetical protein
MVRKTKAQLAASRRRRNGKKAINLLTVGETIVQGSILTRWAFGTNLIPFLTEGWITDWTPGRPNFESQNFGGSGNSWNLSLAEVVQSVVPGGRLGISQAYTDAGGVAPIIARNLRTNAPSALAQMVVANVAFRAGKRVSRKARSMINRNVFKPLGLEKDVKV